MIKICKNKSLRFNLGLKQIISKYYLILKRSSNAQYGTLKFPTVMGNFKRLRNDANLWKMTLNRILGAA